MNKIITLGCMLLVGANGALQSAPRGEWGYASTENLCGVSKKNSTVEWRMLLREIRELYRMWRAIEISEQEGTSKKNPTRQVQLKKALKQKRWLPQPDY